MIFLNQLFYYAVIVSQTSTYFEIRLNNDDFQLCFNFSLNLTINIADSQCDYIFDIFDEEEMKCSDLLFVDLLCFFNEYVSIFGNINGKNTNIIFQNILTQITNVLGAVMKVVIVI
jgi:hypothetical protein